MLCPASVCCVVDHGCCTIAITHYLLHIFYIANVLSLTFLLHSIFTVFSRLTLCTLHTLLRYLLLALHTHTAVCLVYGGVFLSLSLIYFCILITRFTRELTPPFHHHHLFHHLLFYLIRHSPPRPLCDWHLSPILCVCALIELDRSNCWDSFHSFIHSFITTHLIANHTFTHWLIAGRPISIADRRQLCFYCHTTQNTNQLLAFAFALLFCIVFILLACYFCAFFCV